MGRKKRRVPSVGEVEAELSQPPPTPADLPVRSKPPPPPPPSVKIESDDVEKEAVKASNYAMHSHSGEIVEEDIYVSDGSEDEDDNVDVILSGSKMGLMRRGLHQPLLVQPSLRQWSKPVATEGQAVGETDEEQRQKEEELENLDPVERAARLLAEKQRKLEEAKESARRIESEENAGRDPCLFSKRTAFDIRFDQIDEKPWERGNGDLTDFFNYGLTVEDWLEYAQQQLIIRQELTDANRQKRPIDPNIVPVIARQPKSQTPKVAVAAINGEKNEDGELSNLDHENAMAPVMGPTLIKQDDGDGKDAEKGFDDENAYMEVDPGEGSAWGAWGAGPTSDSMLAQLIAEQTPKENPGINTDPKVPVQNYHHNQNDHYSDVKQEISYRDDPSTQHYPPVDSYESRVYSDGYEDKSQQSSYGGGGGDWRQHVPPPPSYNGHDDGVGRFGGRGRGRGRGGRGSYGGRFNNLDRGGRGGPRPPFPPQGQRWGGRGRGESKRPPRDDNAGYFGGGSSYYQR